MIVDLCIDTSGLWVCLYLSFTKSRSFESCSIVLLVTALPSSGAWSVGLGVCRIVVVGIEGVLIA